MTEVLCSIHSFPTYFFLFSLGNVTLLIVYALACIFLPIEDRKLPIPLDSILS